MKAIQIQYRSKRWNFLEFFLLGRFIYNCYKMLFSTSGALGFFQKYLSEAPFYYINLRHRERKTETGEGTESLRAELQAAQL